MLMFLLSNWRLALAGLGIVGLIVGGSGLYIKGRLDAKHKLEVTSLKQQIAILEINKATIERIATEDAKQAEQDQKELDEYEKLVAELLKTLEDAERVCLSPSDTERVRDIFRGKATSKPAPAPKRVL